MNDWIRQEDYLQGELAGVIEHELSGGCVYAMV